MHFRPGETPTGVLPKSRAATLKGFCPTGKKGFYTHRKPQVKNATQIPTCVTRCPPPAPSPRATFPQPRRHNSAFHLNQAGQHDTFSTQRPCPQLRRRRSRLHHDSRLGSLLCVWGHARRWRGSGRVRRVLEMMVAPALPRLQVRQRSSG
jgi:hypothetical protein